MELQNPEQPAIVLRKQAITLDLDADQAGAEP